PRRRRRRPRRGPRPGRRPRTARQPGRRPARPPRRAGRGMTTGLVAQPGPGRAEPLPRGAAPSPPSPREVLLRHAAGVAVITAGRGAPVGLCATSLATVSLEPPVVSFAIAVRSSSWSTIATADLVLAHLLD